MSATTAEFVPDKSSAGRAIILGGVTAGVLDISAAFINAGVQQARSPMFVLQSIASGLLGSESYKGGFRSAALGAALHFTVAFVACAVYYAASRKLKLLTRRAIVSGVLYGMAVYLFMYGVVLPLTFHRNFFVSVSAIMIGVTIHMFCVGLPVSLAVRRYSELAG